MRRNTGSSYHNGAESSAARCSRCHRSCSPPKMHATKKWSQKEKSVKRGCTACDMPCQHVRARARSKRLGWKQHIDQYISKTESEHRTGLDKAQIGDDTRTHLVDRCEICSSGMSGARGGEMQGRHRCCFAATQAKTMRHAYSRRHTRGRTDGPKRVSLRTRASDSSNARTRRKAQNRQAATRAHHSSR